MKATVLMTVMLATALALQLGCGSGELTAPNATEPFPVTIQMRVAAQGEAIPAIQVSANAGSLAIGVTRRAMCATQVSAAVRRGSGQVDVVSHVSSNPAADCAPILANTVVDYFGTVSSLPPGAYLIRVFEGEGDGTPQFIGSATVRIPAS